MKQLIECVPNISEGRNEGVISKIASVVETVEGVTLLDVDPGKATNRTVITFVGEPAPVIEAAFRLIEKASELIDMSKHSGEHPRFGATDVCPLVPVANISMEETVSYAHALGKRVGEELGIPGYFYENAAKEEKRRNLANCRSGEYEGLVKKLVDPDWIPDFGPAEFVKAKNTGSIAISARDFLVAYNINLNTTSPRRANAIAFAIRERGRVKREGDKLTGKIIKDENGDPINIPGSLKAVKGIGWFIEEYGIAQLSLNLTNIRITSMHEAFDEASEKARDRGLRVTGSELIGLVPLDAMLDAGKHYLRKQQRSLGVSDAELIKIAIKSMGLDDLKPFHPEEKIIEYKIASKNKQLIDLTLTEFANETASESPAPGGGSISAYVGSLGVSLGTMVANLSAHKRGWDDRWEEFSNWAVIGMGYQKQLQLLVDEDTNAFNTIMDAFGLPKGNEEETNIRKEAIENATKYATEIPFKVLETCYKSMEVMHAMAESGNPNSVTDAGVGALCARTAVRGALLNVKINAAGLTDTTWAAEIVAKGEEIARKAKEQEDKIMQLVEAKL
jgi:glutamate formiminotransferase/formiminotetrahydrofolate cyclodeaminase